jgi:hypothetical protein
VCKVLGYLSYRFFHPNVNVALKPIVSLVVKIMGRYCDWPPKTAYNSWNKSRERLIFLISGLFYRSNGKKTY